MPEAVLVSGSMGCTSTRSSRGFTAMISFSCCGSNPRRRPSPKAPGGSLLLVLLVLFLEFLREQLPALVHRDVVGLAVDGRVGAVDHLAVLRPLLDTADLAARGRLLPPGP